MIPRIGNDVKFIDVDKDSWQISLDNVTDKISKEAVGIIGVHLYGFAFDVENISNFMKKITCG